MSKVNPLPVVSGMYEEKILLLRFERTTTVCGPTPYAEFKGRIPKAKFVPCRRLLYIHSTHYALQNNNKYPSRIGQNTLPEQHQCIDWLFQSISDTIDQVLLHRWLVLRASSGDCARTIVAMMELATAMCTSE
mmetsp:Transcript_31471/g.45854  ORF Transcript_31471/g.45854 Transcript_31471/m.45854 type:complete len:133 (-) Transcript_31471:331-729(-)